ncbi:hypothetical protein REC12_00950 [Desulfosporosinus sp. PR]|uniref:hypothetical protein n=1 Tax=Candidatus Desulfosporosinus nitrosoreducens TaxID=3401928 RepID=UPI0027F200E3|nr:hypothetical protein [Desulfosporosinus sp. PR]MDQ7092156.1 hypothetical protein [Desulfosporosinus sp. PR]
MSSINPVSSQYANVSQSQQTNQTSVVKKHHHHQKSQQAGNTQDSSSPQDILDLGSQNNTQQITYSKPVNQAQAAQYASFPIPE